MRQKSVCFYISIIENAIAPWCHYPLAMNMGEIGIGMGEHRIDFSPDSE